MTLLGGWILIIFGIAMLVAGIVGLRALNKAGPPLLRLQPRLSRPVCKAGGPGIGSRGRP